jgi:hypothetical protein
LGATSPVEHLADRGLFEHRDVATIDLADEGWFETRPELTMERNLGFYFGHDRGMDAISINEVREQSNLTRNEELNQGIRIAQEKLRIRHETVVRIQLRC